MLHKSLILACAATLAVLLTTREAQAWGAAHVGYTHVGPGGVQHYGRTAAVGPYGAYSGGHASDYGRYGGSYHTGYGAAYGGAYHYAGASRYGGAGYAGGYRAGVYRRW